MSTLYGVNYTKYLTPDESNTLARGGGGGKLCVHYDTYEASSTTAADVVYWGPGPLQKGDIVIGYILSTDDLGTSNTISIGDTASATRYASALDTASAVVSGNVAVLVDGMGYTVGTTSGDDIIMLTLNTAACTGTIKCAILYIRQ